MTKSASRSERNCARTSRATVGQEATPIASAMIGSRRLADRDDDDDQQEGGHGLEQLGQAHQQGVEPAAEIARRPRRPACRWQGRSRPRRRRPAATRARHGQGRRRRRGPGCRCRAGNAGSSPGQSVGVPPCPADRRGTASRRAARDARRQRPGSATPTRNDGIAQERAQQAMALRRARARAADGGHLLMVQRVHVSVA